MWGPTVISWFINPMNTSSFFGIINHSEIGPTFAPTNRDSEPGHHPVDGDVVEARGYYGRYFGGLKTPEYLRPLGVK